MSTTHIWPTRPSTKSSEDDRPVQSLIEPVKGCFLCPRACGSPRTPERPGFCGANEGFSDYRVARVMVHHWEEPFISGKRGSGAVFFSNCALRCCFCQNASISQHQEGERLSPDQLTRAVQKLLESDVHNINLVTPDTYADRLPVWLHSLYEQQIIKHTPVIWNTGSYATPASLKPLQDLVSIYLADIKFFDPNVSLELAAASDYFEVASSALREMILQQPEPVYDREGLLKRGVVIRLLILPGHHRDACRILTHLAGWIPLKTPIVLLRQYTPQPTAKQVCRAKLSLTRKLTTWEYEQVVQCALDLSFENLTGQGKQSADSRYTPDFGPRFRPGRI